MKKNFYTLLSTLRFQEIEKMFYTFSSSKRFSLFENSLCTFFSTLNFRVFENWVCIFYSTFSFVVFKKKVFTFCSTFENLKVKKIFCTFWFNLQNLRANKNPRKKDFINVRLERLKALFREVKTEKLRFLSFFYGFKKFPPKTERLKLLAQNLAVIKSNELYMIKR